MKLARLHARIADVRRNNLYHLTTSITLRFQTIVIEDLNVKGMKSPRGFHQSGHWKRRALASASRCARSPHAARIPCYAPAPLRVRKHGARIARVLQHVRGNRPAGRRGGAAGRADAGGLNRNFLPPLRKGNTMHGYIKMIKKIRLFDKILNSLRQWSCPGATLGRAHPARAQSKATDAVPSGRLMPHSSSSLRTDTARTIAARTTCSTRPRSGPVAESTNGACRMQALPT